MGRVRFALGLFGLVGLSCVSLVWDRLRYYGLDEVCLVSVGLS
jgi:hypothetical protein